MKILLSYLMFFTISCLLISCASTQTSSSPAGNLFNHQQVVATTARKYPATNPQQVALFSANTFPRKAYKIIGTATVAKHDLFGMERSDAAVDHLMRKLAASIGGDALINVTSNEQNKQAKIVAYQKILL